METNNVYIYIVFSYNKIRYCLLPFFLSSKKKVHAPAHWKITNPMMSNLTNITADQHIDVYRPNRHENIPKCK